MRRVPRSIVAVHVVDVVSVAVLGRIIIIIVVDRDVAMALPSLRWRIRRRRRRRDADSADALMMMMMMTMTPALRRRYGGAPAMFIPRPPDCDAIAAAAALPVAIRSWGHGRDDANDDIIDRVKKRKLEPPTYEVKTYFT